MYSLRQKIRILLFRAALIFLFTLIGARCDYRSRSNPLDPENEITRGKPTGLSAISAMDSVWLSWPDMNFPNLDQYVIYRADSSPASVAQVGSVPATNRTFLDTGLIYNKTYTYRISAQVDDFESQRSDPVSITPGPTFKWVLDYGSGVITKLSHDGRHPVFQTNYNGYPEKIAVNSADGSGWVFDEFLNRIYHLDRNGRLLRSFENYNRIRDLEIDPRTGGLWLVDGQNARLIKINANGEKVFNLSNLSRPTALAVGMKSGNCWLVDSDGGRIYLITPDGNVTKQLEFSFLGVSALGVHEASGTLWIADSLRLLRVQGQHVQPVAEFRLLELAVDPADGSCWVGARSGISKFSVEGGLLFTRENEFYVPVLAVNPYNHTCLIADRYRAWLTEISGDGLEMKEIKSVSYPSAVVVEYQTHP